MKRVLFVATVVRLHINVFHQPYIRWFHEQGWQVDVAANNDYDRPEDCVIPCCDHFYCMPFERSPLKKGNLDAYRQLKKLLDEQHYDIIHCHTPMGSVVARLAAGSARNRGTKVIYTAHGFHFFRGAPAVNWLLYYPVERLLARRTDLLITMNREDDQRARTFPAKRTALVNGVGVNIDRFYEPSPEEILAVRQELGLGRDDVYALSVAQLIPRKNHTTLIQAVAKLNDPHFHLFICGDGQQENELRQLARSLGVEAQIHFLLWRQDVDRLCRAADLFLFAPLQEGLPLSLMEAMACGLPIVASDVRGNCDLIDNGKGGFLLPPHDVDGFVRAIRTVLADEQLRQAMKAHNRRRIRAYGIPAVVEQMAQLYQSMM